jgi:molybdopterin converting factor small subunit
MNKSEKRISLVPPVPSSQESTRERKSNTEPTETRTETSRVNETQKKQALLQLLVQLNVGTKDTLELIASQAVDIPLNAASSVDTLAEYGLMDGDISPVESEQLQLLARARESIINMSLAEELSERIETVIANALFNRALNKMDALTNEIQSNTKAEQTESSLESVMSTLDSLSKKLPPMSEKWEQLIEKYKGVLALKDQGGVEVQEIFRGIFDKYSDTIDNELVTRELKLRQAAGQNSSVEEVMQSMFGRTPDEIAKLKSENRMNVVKLIDELKEQTHITFNDITKLHAVNNRGIVPKSYSKMRDFKDGTIVTFGTRVGTLEEDLPGEIDAFDKRLDDFQIIADAQKIGDLAYRVGVAKMHNELLDMHPYADRNGSTTLLFVELMMARRGYEPPEKKESSYYKALGGALSFDPIAMSLVGHEHYKIANVPGYFEGETTKRNKKTYDRVVDLVVKQREAQKKSA